MSITLRNVTKLVLLAVVAAGFLFVITASSSAAIPLKIAGSEPRSSCWTGTTGSYHCCVLYSNPDCDWNNKQYYECGTIATNMCDSSEISKVQDKYGWLYCCWDCPCDEE